jgi:glycosyltransferase involved in cell wall biosynthesis
MYDADRLDTGPSVRVGMLRDALARRTDLQVIAGPRLTRAREMVRWLLRRRRSRINAVYVEAASSFATPIDLAFLAVMRLRGAAVGVYFRDAYQLFRDQYPLARSRQRALDWLWRLSTPLLKRLATTAFAPSSGLADVLRLRDAVLLPPGTDPSTPVLGTAPGALVAYVGATGAADGLPLLMEAMQIVRARRPDAELVVVSAHDPRAHPGDPAWLHHEPADRAALARVLGPARLCVIPRPITPYTDLAVPIKLMDYLSFGKPIVATRCLETAQVLETAQAGLMTHDHPADLADAVVHVIESDYVAASLAASARAYAVDPAHTWDARADQIVRALVRGSGADYR